MKMRFFDLTGKVALISGGATGIGRGIAEGLAEAGASVAIAARRKEMCECACSEISQKYGVRSFPACCDITQKGEIGTVVRSVTQSLGHVDILVNNAGIGGSEKPILSMSESDWDVVISTNLSAVFTLTKTVVADMVEQRRGGKIINVASIGGMIAWPNMSAYCASKGGCIQLTKVMALEWTRHNIQVNAILPGYFDTPMNTGFFATETGQGLIRHCIPMRRLARVEEIKGVAILLASEASSFMTGSSIVIDGGQTCA